MQSFLSITKPKHLDNYGHTIPTSPRSSPGSSPLTLSAIQLDSPSSNESNNDAERLLNETSNTLIQLIETNINLPSFELSNSEKTWIKLLISNSPESFAPLDSFLNAILSSGNLSVETIPELIKLFADVFNTISLEQNIANSHNVYVLIKFIMDIIIDIIPLSRNEVLIIKIVAESSLSLLSTILADAVSAEEAKQDVSSQEPEVSIRDAAQILLPEVKTNKCCTFFKFFGK
jgi:hypothetical protein